MYNLLNIASSHSNLEKNVLIHIQKEKDMRKRDKKVIVGFLVDSSEIYRIERWFSLLTVYSIE